MASRTLCEDGLVLPPMLLCRGGEFDKSVFNLIAANTRYPEAVLPDFRVIHSNLDLGEQLIRESIGSLDHSRPGGTIPPPHLTRLCGARGFSYAKSPLS